MGCGHSPSPVMDTIKAKVMDPKFRGKSRTSWRHRESQKLRTSRRHRENLRKINKRHRRDFVKEVLDENIRLKNELDERDAILKDLKADNKELFVHMVHAKANVRFLMNKLQAAENHIRHLQQEVIDG